MPQLYFNPPIQSVPAYTPFNLEIWLDTGGVAVDGVDIDLPLQGLVLNNLTVTTLLANKFVASTPGKILFSQFITPGGPKFTGSGLLATATLTASANTILNFNFTLSATNDTNLASGGVDILTSVGTAIINIGTNQMPPNLPAGLNTAIQTWLTANAKGAVFVITTGTYTPPPTPQPAQPVTGSYTG